MLSNGCNLKCELMQRDGLVKTLVQRLGSSTWNIRNLSFFLNSANPNSLIEERKRESICVDKGKNNFHLVFLPLQYFLFLCTFIYFSFYLNLAVMDQNHALLCAWLVEFHISRGRNCFLWWQGRESRHTCAAQKQVVLCLTWLC